MEEFQRNDDICDQDEFGSSWIISLFKPQYHVEDHFERKFVFILLRGSLSRQCAGWILCRSRGQPPHGCIKLEEMPNLTMHSTIRASQSHTRWLTKSIQQGRVRNFQGPCIRVVCKMPQLCKYFVICKTPVWPALGKLGRVRDCHKSKNERF